MTPKLLTGAEIHGRTEQNRTLWEAESEPQWLFTFLSAAAHHLLKSSTDLLAALKPAVANVFMIPCPSATVLR